MCETYASRFPINFSITGSALCIAKTYMYASRFPINFSITGSALCIAGNSINHNFCLL